MKRSARTVVTTVLVFLLAVGVSAGAAVLARNAGVLPDAGPTPSMTPTPPSRDSTPTPLTPPDAGATGSAEGDDGMPTAPESSAKDPDIVLAFGGDVHFTGNASQQLAPGGLSTLPDLFAGADLTAVNLETAITTRGTAQAKEYVFRAPRKALTALAGAGIDIVAMANNHALDYGDVGLRDTLDAVAAGPVHAVGIGADLSAAVSPAVIDIPHRTGDGSTTVSVFSVTTAEPFDDMPARRWAAGPSEAGVAVWKSSREALLSSISREARAGRVVVVLTHWGIEGASCPSLVQHSVARQLTDAGASVIIGSHPHVVQGAGFTAQDAVIAYSTGNLVWYNDYSGPGAVIRVGITDGIPHVLSVTGVRVGKDGAPRAIRGDDGRRLTDKITGRLARCANLSSSLQ